jgi:hypothetical protein
MTPSRRWLLVECSVSESWRLGLAFKFQMLTQAGLAYTESPVVCALRSPDGVLETGLRIASQRKRRESLPGDFSRTLSPVRFEGEACGIAAISSDFRRATAWFLCKPDCLAEGKGFEPPVPFPVQWFSRSTISHRSHSFSSSRMRYP